MTVKQQIIQHLMTTNYSFMDKTGDGWDIYEHDTFPPIILTEHEFLVFIMSAYQINDSAKTDESRFLEIVNELNRRATQATYVALIDNKDNPDQLMIKTTWRGKYDKNLFDIFLYDWQYETVTALWEIDGIDDFIILTRKPKLTA